MLGRVLFYPTLVSNVFWNRFGSRAWYTRIDDRVILGALPFKSMTEQLQEEGVTAVVTMNQPYETKYLCNTQQEWQSAGISQLCLPTDDFTSTPTQQQIDEGVQFILTGGVGAGLTADTQETTLYSTHTSDGTSGLVYVHCKAGRTRSATLVACYLMKRHGWSADEAVSHIRDKRPHIILRQKQLQSLQLYQHRITQQQQSPPS